MDTPSTPLKCAACGEPVTQVEETVSRSCEHTDAPVIAEMTAVAYGESHFD